jgi:LysM repeat protein
MKKTILSAFLVLTLATSAQASVYIVKKGDTLTSIAQKLGITLEKLKISNPNIKSSDLNIGQKILLPSENTTYARKLSTQGLSQAKVYVVEKGDSAYNIAKKLGCSLDQLKKLNPNIDLSNLNIGDRLILPDNTKIASNTQVSNIYIVKSGDTASKIADKYNIPLSELSKLNPQLNLSNINIGDRIIVPTSITTQQKIVVQKQIPLNSDAYTVEPKDTLIGISEKTGISIDNIKKLNPNVDWSNLQIGQKLVLKEPKQGEPVSQNTTVAATTNEQDNNYIKYTVGAGDTLYSIAKAFSTKISTLRKINSLSSNSLSVGQILLVPPKIIGTNKQLSVLKKTVSDQAQNQPTKNSSENKIVTNNYDENKDYSLYLDHYIVQKGDTLYTIAKKFDTSVDDIASLNNLANNKINIGETLLIPKNNTNLANTKNNYSSGEYSLVNKENTLNERLVKYAKLFIGAPYQWGGTNLSTGVDCSGFVQDIFAKFHIELPRTSSEQFNVGKPVPLADIKPGDLLFFKTYAGVYPSHVGIYIGDNKFISALNQNTGVVISPLDGYFLNRFVGARRVLPSHEKFDYTGNRSG